MADADGKSVLLRVAILNSKCDGDVLHQETCTFCWTSTPDQGISLVRMIIRD